MGTNVLSRRTLAEIGKKYPDVYAELLRWEKMCRKSDLTCFADIQSKIDPKVSWVGPKYLIFNIGGNRYRLITTVNFQRKTIWVKEFMTHTQYNGWKPEK